MCSARGLARSRGATSVCWISRWVSWSSRREGPRLLRWGPRQPRGHLTVPSGLGGTCGGVGGAPDLPSPYTGTGGRGWGAEQVGFWGCGHSRGVGERDVDRPARAPLSGPHPGPLARLASPQAATLLASQSVFWHHECRAGRAPFPTGGSPYFGPRSSLRGSPEAGRRARSAALARWTFSLMTWLKNRRTPEAPQLG